MHFSWERQITKLAVWRTTWGVTGDFWVIVGDEDGGLREGRLNVFNLGEKKLFKFERQKEREREREYTHASICWFTL